MNRRSFVGLIGMAAPVAFLGLPEPIRYEMVDPMPWHPPQVVDFLDCVHLLDPNLSTLSAVVMNKREVPVLLRHHSLDDPDWMTSGRL